MGLTRIAVYRPVVALTVTVALILFGVLSYFSLGLEQSPQLKLPIVTVQVVYPGASAETVEEQVTRPIEDTIAGLGNVKNLTSISRTGYSTITVEFTEGVDVDVAASDVQQRVSSERRQMPADVEEPSYFKLDFNDFPILYLAITAPGGSATPADEQSAIDLYRLADEQVRPRLETAKDVGRVEVVGGREPEVQVEVLPDRLRAYGLSISDVVGAVRSQFLSTSGGEVRSGSAERSRSTTLRIDSRSNDLSDLGDFPVATPDGGATELKNVARIYLGGKQAESSLRVNGRPAAGLLVYKQSSANITQAVDGLLPLVDQLGQGLPLGYQLEVAVDTSRSIRQTVRGVEEELVLAAVITGLVLFLFLHSLRSTIIVLVAIPTSLLLALITMKLAGLSLNTMTLVALTTAIGVLVDDSIVVLENISSHLERGQDPKQAAVDGRGEIGLAAIAITLVDVAVWGPIIFVSGITGAFLRNFAIVMVAATLASLVVSFTLTPLIASRWLSRSHNRSPLARLASSWEPLYRLAERAYVNVLPWALRHRPLVLLSAILVFAANFVVLPRLGSEFVPNVDEDTIIVIGELPAGTSLEATELAAQRWETAILDHTLFPEIEKSYVVAGRGDSDFDLEPRFISLTLALTEPGARTRRSQDLGKLVAAIGEETVPGLQARLSGGNGGGQPVQVRIFGDDLDELTRLAASAQASLASQPELADVTNGMSAAPELTIKPDPGRLKDFGLTTYQVGNTVRIAYQGAEVGKWVQPGGKERDVLVRMPTELRRNPSAVADLPLIRRGEQMITIRQVAGAVAEDKPSKIMRVDRQRVATVGAEPRGVPLGTASATTTKVMNAILPPSAEAGLKSAPRWAFAGESEDQAESFAQLGLGLAASIILMYFVLTVLYESAIYPLVVLAALPLASVGAFLGLLFFNQTLSVPSFIGLIALFGLVGKNSILLVDRTNTLRRQGLDRTAALVQAGPSRLRPIIMTSAVLVLSMLPVALKLGDGGEIRAPIGAVLVGGMTTSTFLSLLFVPVVYTYFDSLQELIFRVVSWRPVFRRPRSTGQHEDSPAKLERQTQAEAPAARQLAPIAGGAPSAAERVRLLRDHGRPERRSDASRMTETFRSTHPHQLLARRASSDSSAR